MDKCKRFLEGMDAKHLEGLNPSIIERAFERLTQAMESGIVSKRKIPSVITKDEYEHLKVCRGHSDSKFILKEVYEGKIKVKKNVIV
jgi:DNA-binding transcriptional regulator YhcF (GntR family)